MIKKYFIPIGITIGLLLLIISASCYPGGSQRDQHSIGYSWQYNYISNLFGSKAINGADSSSPPWAISAMLTLSVSFAFFFIEFSKKISSKREAAVIKYFGLGAMLFAFLAVTPYHDTVIGLASTLELVSMFYITVFVFKSKLHVFKFICVIYLLASYSCLYVYYTRNYLEFLPVMQKLSLVILIILVLGLQYFSSKEDFEHIK